MTSNVKNIPDSPNSDKEIYNPVNRELLRENLKLSYDERLEQHQAMLDLIDEMQKIGRTHREKSEPTAATPDSKRS